MSEITVNPQDHYRKLTPEHAGLFVIAALFLTILSPFGTDSDLTIPMRFLYWFSVIFGGTAIALAISNVFQRHAKANTGLTYVLIRSLQVLTASVPITVLVAIMENWLREPMSWIHLPQLFVYVVTITAVITAASSLVEQHSALKDQLRVDRLGAERQLRSRESLAFTRFHLRLDPTLRQADILMLKAEDHYLRVSTSEGSQSIRCNLSKAVGELGALEGQRVHRSFWVARSAILSIKRLGNSYRLIMNDGTTVPLSRRRYGELSKCDWLPI
jgi:hypothetical protein